MGSSLPKPPKTPMCHLWHVVGLWLQLLGGGRALGHAAGAQREVSAEPKTRRVSLHELTPDTFSEGTFCELPVNCWEAAGQAQEPQLRRAWECPQHLHVTLQLGHSPGPAVVVTCSWLTHCPDPLPTLPSKIPSSLQKIINFQLLIFKENSCWGSKLSAAMHTAGWERRVGTEKLQKAPLQKFIAGRTEAAAAARSSILPCTLL